MKIKGLFSIITILVIALLVSCKPGTKSSDEETGTEAVAEAVAEVVAEPNTLTDKEVEEGWILMFDGESFDGWRGYGFNAFPDSGWAIEDGCLKCLHSGTGEAGAGGDVLYDKKFTNFHLKLDWMIEEGGNSGIFYLGQELDGKKIWYTAPEYQILDNFSDHIDTKLGKNGNRLAGTLYDLIPADPQNAKGAMKWNTTEILVYEGTVAHIMNGEVVLEYHLWTDEWKAMIENSKFPEFNPDFANVAKTGYICLQDHGHAVWFRNIKIKE